MSFINELKRRSVFKVTVAYGLVAWLIAQLAEFAISTFGAPDWVLRTFVVLLVLGLPVAIILAWAFDMTPSGIKKTSTEKTATSEPRGTNFVVVILLGVVLAAAVVLLGTLYPLFLDAIGGDKVSVGAPFFDLAFTPFMIALAMILPIGAMLPWKRGGLRKAARPLWGVLALSVALGALVWVMQTGGRMMAPIGVTLAAWLVLGAAADLGVRVRLGKAPLPEALRRLGSLPRADWGKAVSHAGLGLTIFGIAAVTAWETEDIRVANIGDSYSVAGYEFRFEDVRKRQGKNYSFDQGVFTAVRNGKVVAELLPEKRFYPVQRMPTTEAAIDSGLSRDLYVVLGDPQPEGGYAVRVYIKPFANWIWIGCIVMALGGLLSLTDRRYRVGAARHKTAAAAVAAE